MTTVDFLAAVAGLSESQVRYAMRRESPVVLAMPDLARMGAFVDATLRGGGRAFGFALDRLALAETHAVRDLAVGELALDVTTWDGTTQRLLIDDIELLVRGTSGGPRRARPPDAEPHLRLVPATTTERLDIHGSDGTVYELDGDRFGFGPLGALHAMNDSMSVDPAAALESAENRESRQRRESMDGMLDLLRDVAPQAIVDAFFAMWVPPAGCRLESGPTVSDPSFAFYSRWVAMTYREITDVGYGLGANA